MLMSGKRQFCLVFVAAGCFAGAGIWLSSGTSPVPEAPVRPARDVQPATRLVSRYRSVFASEFSGNASCQECHIAETQLFNATPHSRSLEKVRPEDEPSDVEFAHAVSRRAYRVFRRDGELWHREFANDDQGEISLGEFPVAWRIGSGHHSRSYLIDVDGYLFESPVTWYSATGSWGISPGYDFHGHEGFSRAAHQGCIQCHASRVESAENSTHHLALVEPSIGCESCHGPGAMHVRERTSEVSIVGKFDDTIVHPGKQSREINEAICARCHLRGAGWSNVRGRSSNDFRPGLLMTDFRVDFAPKDSTGEMKVVGHFEQMHASRCYIESDTLTCTTCHNPHAAPSAEIKVEYYQRKCLSCHEPKGSGCTLPEPERLAESPADNCVACHMPKSGTDIPHFSFTHHRIATLHPRQVDDQEEETLSALVPIGDVSRLSTLDLERCLGRAWLRYGDSLKTHARFAAFDEATRRLHRVYQAGMQDAGVSGGLAYLYWNKRDPVCIDFAKQALSSPDCTAEIRSDSLIVLGDMHFELGNIAAAEAAFDELTRLRLRYTDWQMLGICRARLGKLDEAILAFQTAVKLKPGAVELHLLLATALNTAGQKSLAEMHRKTAMRLEKQRSDDGLPNR